MPTVLLILDVSVDLSLYLLEEKYYSLYENDFEAAKNILQERIKKNVSV